MHVLRSFYEFGMPFMKKLGDPTLFCHKLTVDEASGAITDYNLRLEDPKVSHSPRSQPAAARCSLLRLALPRPTQPRKSSRARASRLSRS